MPERHGGSCICTRPEAGGDRSLRDVPGGRHGRVKRLFGTEQDRKVQQSLRNRKPDQITMIYVLCMRQAVAHLIRDPFSIERAVRSMAKNLSRGRLTSRGPIRKGYEQSFAAVQKLAPARAKCSR